MPKVENQDCKSCRFLDTGSSTCHRFPPTINFRGKTAYQEARAFWPIMSPSDWCGEWAPDKPVLDGEQNGRVS